MQMKKACLTMRQRQMQELEQKGELPVSMMAHVGSDKPVSRSGALPPPVSSVKRTFTPQEGALRTKKPATSPVSSLEDPFTREITVSQCI